MGNAILSTPTSKVMSFSSSVIEATVMFCAARVRVMAKSRSNDAMRFIRVLMFFLPTKLVNLFEILGHILQIVY